MHNRWQLLVIMALALAAYGGDNNSGTELSAAQEVSTTTTIQPTTTTEPTPTTTTTNPPGEREPAQPGSGSGETTPTGQEKTYKVVEGDTLWTIAQDHLAMGSGEPTDQEVAEYVDQVEKTNRDRLQSGDPDLIEPGETIILPPVAARPAPEAGRNTHDVAQGDTLWTIARDHLAKATGAGSGEPTNQEVTEYWTRVKEANQGRLQSGDPDLIYLGEEITLPAVPPAPAEPAPETRVQASHVVVEGDNLWTIARDHLAEARSGGAGELTTREVAAYWLRVVEANARNVRSGDPDLIYPGETIVLPPVD